MVTKAQFESANRQGEIRQQGPRVIAARFDSDASRVVLSLSTKIDLSFQPEDIEGLDSASADQLDSIEISPSGLGVYFPKLDADIYLPALLEGVRGSRKWMAAQIGARGGAARSEAKAQASKLNGKLGGRPRKSRPEPVAS
jgi:hypothetical protein